MSVLVNKDRLIETLKKNRDEHREIFLRAQGVYREKVIEELDKRLEQARSGGVINLGFTLPTPEDYTNEYDVAIQKYEWHVEDEVELDDDEFRTLVLNQWHWARRFATNTTAYLAMES